MTSDALLGTWTHSHEEDHDGIQIFRPEDFSLPPSRGRSSFTLRPDGTAVSDQPGPDDRGAVAAGTWSVDGEVLSIRHPAGVTEYTVLAATADRLELRPD